MGIFKKDWQIKTSGKGTYEITCRPMPWMIPGSRMDWFQFLCTRVAVWYLWKMPITRTDSERFMDDLVPDNYPHFIHTCYEGPDDMPSHIKMALTRAVKYTFCKWASSTGHMAGSFSLGAPSGFT